MTKKKYILDVDFLLEVTRMLLLIERTTNNIKNWKLKYNYTKIRMKNNKRIVGNVVTWSVMSGSGRSLSYNVYKREGETSSRDKLYTKLETKLFQPPMCYDKLYTLHDTNPFIG